MPSEKSFLPLSGLIIINWGCIGLFGFISAIAAATRSSSVWKDVSRLW